jgi:CspA family cold shock protein
MAERLGRFASLLTGAHVFRFYFQNRRGDNGHDVRQNPASIPLVKGHFHDYRHCIVLQRPKGLRFHSAGQLRRGLFVHATALERAAISGLREGQEVKFDKGIDPRSGKAAVATIEIA